MRPRDEAPWMDSGDEHVVQCCNDGCHFDPEPWDKFTADSTSEVSSTIESNCLTSLPNQILLGRANIHSLECIVLDWTHQIPLHSIVLTISTMRSSAIFLMATLALPIFATPIATSQVNCLLPFGTNDVLIVPLGHLQEGCQYRTS